MQRDQKKRDKKRKEKQAEKKRQLRQVESLAYLGQKYRADELIPTQMHAEIGVYQAFIMCDGKFTDATVAAAVEKLIRRMRDGSLPPLGDEDSYEYVVGEEEELIIDCIRRSWANHFAENWKPPRDSRIGVLRTMLGTIDTMGAPGRQSRGYLQFIFDFLENQIGVKMWKLPPGVKPPGIE
jgi:hypothetical protein